MKRFNYLLENLEVLDVFLGLSIKFRTEYAFINPLWGKFQNKQLFIKKNKDVEEVK